MDDDIPTKKRKRVAPLDIDNITGKTYLTNAEQQIQSERALQCPHPHLEVFAVATYTLDLSLAGSSKCSYAFTRGYDLWRHLRTIHGVEAERDTVDQWVRDHKGGNV